MKKNTVQAQQWLEKCYRDSDPSKTTICGWYAGMQTSKKCSKERDATPKRKSSPKRTLIPRPKINRSTRKVLKC